MPSGALQPGDLVMVDLPAHVPGGMHEQENQRPAIVTGVPDATGPARFGMLVIVPCTSQRPDRLRWAGQNPTIYPLLSAGAGGLQVDSIALLDQVRGIDSRRVRGFVGRLAPAEYQPIADGLRALFGL